MQKKLAAITWDNEPVSVGIAALKIIQQKITITIWALLAAALWAGWQAYGVVARGDVFVFEPLSALIWLVVSALATYCLIYATIFLIGLLIQD